MGEKISNDISSESTHQIHSPKIMHTPRQSLYEIVQRIVKFKILDFCHIFFFFFSLTWTWDHMGVKVSNDISSETTHQICSPKFMYTSGEGLYQSC